jgi:hypothetical protein
MNGLNLELVLQVFGAVFILLGLAGMLGIWKGWYWRSQRSVYGYIPFGLMFLMSSFEARIRLALGPAGWLVIVVYVILFALGVLGFSRPPQFLKPRWTRLIEAQPRAVYDAMAREVRAGEKWRPRVATQEALEEWIREVRRVRPKTAKKR